VPEAHFVIIGAGPLQAKVESLIAARGIESHLTLIGERRDAVNLISSFAVGVLTSRAEGLPNALLEYMFWACPSVVTEVGDCGRLVKQSKGGYIVPTRDADTLAARIIGLLRDPVEAATLGQSARSYLEREFSLTRYCDSLLALYATALEQHRRVTN
jgi:glycosyltransferase involved in cell wall biosynthesis